MKLHIERIPHDIQGLYILIHYENTFRYEPNHKRNDWITSNCHWINPNRFDWRIERFGVNQWQFDLMPSFNLFVGLGSELFVSTRKTTMRPHDDSDEKCWHCSELNYSNQSKKPRKVILEKTKVTRWCQPHWKYKKHIWPCPSIALRRKNRSSTIPETGIVQRTNP